MTLSDKNIIDAPAFPADAVIARQSPAEAGLTTIHHYPGQIDDGGDEPAGVAAPRAPSRERIASPAGDGRVIAPSNKGSSHRWVGDVRKDPVIDSGRRNLQDAAVKAALQVVVLPKSQSRVDRFEGNESCRVQVLVADAGGIVDPCGVGRRIRRW